MGVLFYHVMYIMQSTVLATWLQWLYTQQGNRGVHMNDFSINNAPLIIVLLFKGEWQSFLSSRGGRGLCVSGKAWFTFWKVHLIPGGVCLSFSVNTDSELSLLWNTHHTFVHRLHYGCFTISFYSLCFVEKPCPNPHIQIWNCMIGDGLLSMRKIQKI